MIGNTSYVHIGGWMINELGLGGTELLVYAVIYSFTNGTNDHCFHGSAGYLSEWCGISRRQVMTILKRLEDKGLINREEKIDNGVKFVSYFTGYENISQGDMKKLHDGGYENISHHNNRSINKNIEDNNSTYSPEENFSIKNFDEGGIEHPQAPVELEELGFYDFDDPYVQSMMKNKNFWNNNWKSLQKLMKKGYTIDTIKTVCAFIRQDDFWCKNIRSLNKLLEKNKDGVMYIDVMIDKIKQWKPRNNFIPSF